MACNICGMAIGSRDFKIKNLNLTNLPTDLDLYREPMPHVMDQVSTAREGLPEKHAMSQCQTQPRRQQLRAINQKPYLPIPQTTYRGVKGNYRLRSNANEAVRITPIAAALISPSSCVFPVKHFSSAQNMRCSVVQEQQGGRGIYHGGCKKEGQVGQDL